MRDRLPDRYSTSIEQFSYVEKFDTWLNLGAWSILQDVAITVHDWEDLEDSFTNPIMHNIDKRLLKSTNITIQEFVNLKLSPILPALTLKYLFEHPINQCHVKSSRMKDMFQTTNLTAQSAFNIQYTHLLSSLGPDALDKILQYSPNWERPLEKDPPQLMRAAYLYEDLLLVINSHKTIINLLNSPNRATSFDNILKYPNRTVSLPSIQGEAIIFPSFIIMTLFRERWLVPIPYFLEIYNKIAELVSLLKYTHILSVTLYEEQYFHNVIQFLKHLANVIVKKSTWSHNPNHLTRKERLEYDNRGFVYLKAIEGLGVSELIRRSDNEKYWDNITLSETLWESLKKDDLVPKVEWQDSLLFRLFSSFNSAQLAGIMGVVKIVGHPSIEVENGLNKLYDRTHNDIQIDENTCQRARAVMTRDIIKNFYRVHGKFPILTEQSLNECPPIKRLVNNRLPLTSPQSQILWRDITIDDWALIHFGKNSEFDIVDNQVTLLKDKALGLTRSKVVQKLMAYEGIDNPQSGKRVLRRALLAYLLDEKFDKGFKTYLNKYMDQDEWTNSVLDYLVIKLTAKELEEKVEGRYFGASPAYERNRRVVQEANNMAFMDKYVPEQLLTPNELTIIKKMYSFRMLQVAHPESYILNISFDFSKWNNNMRKESVDIPAGTVLDEWFGVNLYSKTMKAFEHMFVYYDDGMEHRHWKGQKGGIEGLNQATWTFTFLGGLKDCMEQLGYTYHITVKGDDVRCALVIPKRHLNALDPNWTFKEKIESIRNTLMNQLMNLCSSMGWELNPQESFVSLSLIATSKQYQINDTWLPTDNKKIMKLEAISNVAFPTIEDIISNIFSTAHSVCAQSTVAFPAYLVALWTASKLLYRTFYNKRSKKGLTSDICACLLWPQVIGGLGALPLQTFFVRGENDMLSVSLSLLLHAATTLPDGDPIKRRVQYILCQKIKPKSDPVMLLSDPYAIDIDMPPRPASVIKMQLRRHLKRFCKQKSIVKLLTAKSEISQNAFVETLASLSPYYAKIATALWECSPYYLIEEILAKFLNSSSIIGFLTQGASHTIFSYGGRDLLKLLSKISEDRLNYWINTLDGIKVHKGDNYFGLIPISDVSIMSCATEFASKLRNAAWGKEIKGLTYPSLVDQVKIYSEEDISNLHQTRGWDYRTIYSHIILKVKEATPQLDFPSHHYSSVKGNPPWLGSQTSTSVSLPYQSDNISSPCLKKLRRLMTLWSSVNVFGEEFKKVIEHLLRAYTQVSLERLRVLCAEDGGGHLAHRTPINSFSLTTMPNYRPNLSQLVIVNNENLSLLKTDRRNRTINFAARHYYIVPMVLLPLQGTSLLPEQYPDIFYCAFHHDVNTADYQLCPYCNALVDDEPVQLIVHEKCEMEYFQSFEILSCSEAEESELERAITEVLRKGVLSHIHRAYLNPDNPIAVQLAVEATCQRLILNSIQFRDNMMMEGVKKIPDNELADILAAGVGVKVISSSANSANILRSCKPRHTFICLVREAFWHCIHIAYANDMILGETPLGPVSRIYYNAFISIFTTAGQAGLLTALALAARPPSDGRDADNQLYIPLVFRHGSEKCGDIAAESFFAALWPYFNHWLSERQFPEYIRSPLIEGLTLTDVETKIRSHQQATIHLSFHIIHLSNIENYGSSKQLLKRLQRQHQDIFDDGNISTFDKTNHLIQILRDDNPLLFMRLMTLITLPLWYRFLDISHLDIMRSIQAHVPLKTIDIDITNLNSLCEGFVTLDMILNEPSGWIGLQYVCRNIMFLSSRSDIEQFGQMIIDQFVNYFIGVINFGDLLSESAYVVSSILAPLSSVRVFISCKTTDEALLRANRLNMTEEDIQNEYPNLQLQVLENHQNPNDNLNFDYHRLCSLSHIRVVPNYSFDNIEWEPLSPHHPFYQHVIRLESLYEMSKTLREKNICALDYRNHMKIFGGLNKASIKYVYSLVKCGILSHLEGIQIPVVMILGDGGGSCSKLITSLLPSSQVVMTSLQVINRGTRSGKDEYQTDLPVELQPNFMKDEDRERIHYQGMYPGDIRLAAVQKILSINIQKLGGMCHLIMGEADLSLHNKMLAEIIKAYMKIYVVNSHDSTILTIRIVFHRANFPLNVFIILRMMFKHFHIIPQSTSTITRCELIVVLSHINPLKIEQAVEHINSGYWPSNIPTPWYADIINQLELWVLSNYRLTQFIRYPRLEVLQDWFTQHQVWSLLDLAPLESILERSEWGALIKPNCLCRTYQSFRSELRNLVNQRRAALIPHLRSGLARKSRDLFLSDVEHRREHLQSYLYSHLLLKFLDQPESLYNQDEFIDLVDSYVQDVEMHVLGNSPILTLVHKHQSNQVKYGEDDDHIISIQVIVQRCTDIVLRYFGSLSYQLVRQRSNPERLVNQRSLIWETKTPLSPCCLHNLENESPIFNLRWPPLSDITITLVYMSRSNRLLLAAIPRDVLVIHDIHVAEENNGI